MLFISPILVLLVAPYQKIHAHQTEVMLVVNPVKVQYFLRNVVQPTFHSGPTQINLLLPQKPEEMHPLWSKLTNLIGEVSWKF